MAARDGHCRYAKAAYLYGPSGVASCRGESEWAHLGDKKRFKTRGLAPEERHTTAGSLMLCTDAHQAYDRGPLRIEPLSPAGADGPLRFTRGVLVVEEPA